MQTRKQIKENLGLSGVVAIWDNEGKTFDRYTILLNDGDILGASENPFHPQGFGQYCGSVINGLPKSYLKPYISWTLKNDSHFGVRVPVYKWTDLPKDVIQFAKQSSN